jgi:hypothetical protein
MTVRDHPCDETRNPRVRTLGRSLMFTTDSQVSPVPVTLPRESHPGETHKALGGRARACRGRGDGTDGDGGHGTGPAGGHRVHGDPGLADQARHRDHGREPHVRQLVRQLPRCRRNPGERVVPQPQRVLRLGAERVPRAGDAQRGRRPGRDQTSSRSSPRPSPT